MLSNVLLSDYSTYEIGGPAKLLAEPKNIEEIILMMDEAKVKGLNPFFFGMGSNILFPDHPNPDTLFVSLRKQVEITYNDDRLFVSAGVPLSMLGLLGAMSGVSAFDFNFLLPGTLGAGIYMNAKYFSHQISDIVDSIYYLDLNQPSGGVQQIQVNDCEYGYKKSIFQHQSWLILGAVLKTNMPEWDADKFMASLEELDITNQNNTTLHHFSTYYINKVNDLRRQGRAVSSAVWDVIEDRMGKKHFDYPSCGSVFKNDYSVGEPIGKLVDRLNLRGTMHGGAMISANHGNIIQNHGGAKASDVIYLIRFIQDALDRHYGFVPEPEIVIV